MDDKLFRARQICKLFNFALIQTSNDDYKHSQSLDCVFYNIQDNITYFMQQLCYNVVTYIGFNNIFKYLVVVKKQIKTLRWTYFG